MSQGSLFKDLLTERLAAIGADVDAAGGAKEVGRSIWPKLSPDACQRRMSNLLNHKQRHEFTDDEVWQIKQLREAREENADLRRALQLVIEARK